MTLFELASIFGALSGGAGGALVLSSKVTIFTVLGALGGGIVGFFALPLLVFSVFLIGIAFEKGPKAAWDLVWKRKVD